MTIPHAPRRQLRALADPDGLAVPIIRACAVPGCTVGQYLDPGDQGEHQARAGHAPVPGRPLCPIAGAGQ